MLLCYAQGQLYLALLMNSAAVSSCV